MLLSVPCRNTCTVVPVVTHIVLSLSVRVTVRVRVVSGILVPQARAAFAEAVAASAGAGAVAECDATEAADPVPEPAGWWTHAAVMARVPMTAAPRRNTFLRMAITFPRYRARTAGPYRLTH